MIRVHGPRVLVALPPDPDEQTTASGLVLVRDPDVTKTPTHGIVVQLGEKSGTVDIDDVLSLIDELDQPTAAGDVRAMLKTLGPAPFDVNVGDQVVFSRFVGEALRYDGVDYVILAESDILGIVERKAAA